MNYLNGTSGNDYYSHKILIFTSIVTLCTKFKIVAKQLNL